MIATLILGWVLGLATAVAGAVACFVIFGDAAAPFIDRPALLPPRETDK